MSLGVCYVKDLCPVKAISDYVQIRGGSEGGFFTIKMVHPLLDINFGQLRPEVFRKQASWVANLEPIPLE